MWNELKECCTKEDFVNFVEKYDSDVNTIDPAIPQNVLRDLRDLGISHTYMATIYYKSHTEVCNIQSEAVCIAIRLKDGKS